MRRSKHRPLFNRNAGLLVITMKASLLPVQCSGSHVLCPQLSALMPILGSLRVYTFEWSPHRSHQRTPSSSVVVLISSLTIYFGFMLTRIVRPNCSDMCRPLCEHLGHRRAKVLSTEHAHRCTRMVKTDIRKQNMGSVAHHHLVISRAEGKRKREQGRTGKHH